MTDGNETLYTLADIKDFFQMLYRLNNGMSARNRYKKYIKAVDDAMNKLMDTDCVKVVRCNDCAGWEPEIDPDGNYGRCRTKYSICNGMQTGSEWFCADGERKEE